MNYKSELRGFALDRATRVAEANESKPDLATILSQAEAIVDYLYTPEKDIDSHLQTLFPLLRQSENVELISNLVLTLEQIKAEMEAGLQPREQH